VFVRPGKILVICALIATTGLHWTLLQSVAWVGMIAGYSEHSTFKVALEKTFDGRHPCCLCKAIAAAKKSQQKNEFALQKQKLEFPPFKGDFVLIAPSRFEVLPRVNSSAKSLTQKPLLQPPRGFFV
jgi:hypothetical protein